MANYKDIKYDFSGENLTALNATQLTSGTTPDARYTTLPAVSGANLTSLTATNLSSGTVPTARLGTGTASSSTILYGDNTWAAAGAGGLVLQSQQATANGRTIITSTTYSSTGVTDTITCASSSSKVLVIVSAQFGLDSNNAAVAYIQAKFQLTNNHSGISETSLVETCYGNYFPEDSGMDMILQSTCSMVYIDSPSTTNELTYTLNGAVAQATSGLEVISGGSGAYDKTIILIELSE